MALTGAALWAGVVAVAGCTAPGPTSLIEQVDRALERDMRRLEAGIELTDVDKRFLLSAARAAMEGAFADPPRDVSAGDWPDAPSNVRSQSAKLFVTLITAGRIRGCQSAADGNLLENALAATDRTISDRRFGGPLRKEEVPQTRVDITILLEPERVRRTDLTDPRKGVECGVHAFSLGLGDRRAFFKSSVPVSHGYDLEQALERLGVKAGLGPRGYAYPNVTIRRYPAVHFAESPADGSLVSIYRYNVPVRQAEVSRDAVRRMLVGCGEYMARHVDADGLMTYIYRTYSDRTLDAETPPAVVRKLAATWALAALANELGEPTFRDAAKRSVGHALARYYKQHPEHPLGYLQVGQEANIATAAFALLCLVELDDAEFHAEKRDRLARFLLAMEDRSERRLHPVYLYPASLEDRDAYFAGKEAYYPGEALTALMALYERTGRREYRALAERVFPYYRGLYGQTSKKASFTPWMTRAYTSVYFATQKRRYAEFVLRMNDRLVQSQLDVDAAYADKIGSFFESGTSYSTGVFVESVIEAYRVAKALDDRDRMRRYRRAVQLGLRFLLQCQYRPENLFTVPSPTRTLGGMRTSVYDSSIRIDCVQHAALAGLGARRHVPIEPAPPVTPSR
jgi:AMMECR1 domain-containing protein